MGRRGRIQWAARGLELASRAGREALGDPWKCRVYDPKQGQAQSEFPGFVLMDWRQVRRPETLK